MRAPQLSEAIRLFGGIKRIVVRSLFVGNEEIALQDGREEGGSLLKGLRGFEITGQHLVEVQSVNAFEGGIDRARWTDDLAVAALQVGYLRGQVGIDLEQIRVLVERGSGEIGELVAVLGVQRHLLLSLGRGCPFDEPPAAVLVAGVGGHAEAVAANADHLFLTWLLGQANDTDLVGDHRILARHVAVLAAQVAVRCPPVEHPNVALGGAHPGIEPVVADRLRRGVVVEINKRIERF